MTKIFDVPLYPYHRSPDQDASVPARHPVLIIGAGPVGLTTAIDLAQQGVPVVVLDENDRVVSGSRAICFAKRPLEILDRLGCGQAMVDHGVSWSKGKVFFDHRQVYDFNLTDTPGHKRPAFINLQQYTFEELLVARIHELQAEGAPIEIRGGNKVSAIGQHYDHVTVELDTPEGSYTLEGDWLIACDGTHSATRRMLGLGFDGEVFEDNFLIADVVMQAALPPERWFWFDPPFNPGQSALLHKQPDNVWRIDLQLGRDIDKEREMRPENVIPRIKAMLGPHMEFSLEWVSIYSFRCCRMERFVHGRTIFAGDAAHQVSPFGARGANSGIQDADNLAWKLHLVLTGKAPNSLMESYHAERAEAADENILHSTRATEFITPKSDMSRLLRDAALDLSAQHEFARPLVNSGRLSTPCTYQNSPLISADALAAPALTRPGSPCPDAPLGESFLLDQLGNHFTLLTLDADAPDQLEDDGVIAKRLALSVRDDPTLTLKTQYLGDCPAGVYLIRPDHYIAARRDSFDDRHFRVALRRATGKE